MERRGLIIHQSLSVPNVRDGALQFRKDRTGKAMKIEVIGELAALLDRVCALTPMLCRSSAASSSPVDSRSFNSQSVSFEGESIYKIETQTITQRKKNGRDYSLPRL